MDFSQMAAVAWEVLGMRSLGPSASCKPGSTQTGSSEATGSLPLGLDPRRWTQPGIGELGVQAELAKMEQLPRLGEPVSW